MESPSWLQKLYAKLREQWPPNRVVAVLAAPLASLAGFVATWVAAHFPGIPPLDPNWLAGIFTVATSGAIVAAYKWLDGWQKYEAQLASPTADPMLSRYHRKQPPIQQNESPAAADNAAGGPYIEADDDFLLSQPDDIAPEDGPGGD